MFALARAGVAMTRAGLSASFARVTTSDSLPAMFWMVRSWAQCAASALATRDICSASSLVGTRMSDVAPGRFSVLCRMGRRYAPVLPVPVPDRAKMSRPCRASGMALDCTAVGALHRWSRIPRSSRGSSPKSAKDVAVSAEDVVGLVALAGWGSVSAASFALDCGDCGGEGSGTSCSFNLRFIAMFASCGGTWVLGEC
jgi:hypothetical protein